MLSAGLHFLLLSSLALPLVVALRSGNRVSLLGEEHDKSGEEGTSMVGFLTKEQSSRLLQENVPCIELNLVPSAIVNHELSDPDCFETGCAGGCCRAYYWLLCDYENAFPDISCVCSDKTQDPQNLQPVETTTTTGPVPAATPDATGRPTTEMPELDTISNNENEENDVDFSDNAQPPLVETETELLDTTAPVAAGTVAPDVCMAGSRYGDEGGSEAIPAYTSCQTSVDCIGVGTTISRISVSVNGNGRKILRGRHLKKDDNDIDSTDVDGDDNNSGAVVNSQERAPQVESNFCCLASNCLCGTPPGDDWETYCVPPYTVPSSSTESPPSWSTITVPAPPPTPAAANIDGGVQSTPPGTSNASNSEVPPANEGTSLCSNGSFYQDNFNSGGFVNCVTTSDCQEHNADHCCIVDFCFCGLVKESERSTKCVPASVTSPVTTTTAPPPTPAIPPPQPTTPPPQPISTPTRGPDTAASNNREQSVPPATSSPSGTTVLPVVEETTACSNGSVHHDNFYSTDFVKCVTNIDCQQHNAEECCMVDFCFCGLLKESERSTKCV